MASVWYMFPQSKHMPHRLTSEELPTPSHVNLLQGPHTSVSYNQAQLNNAICIHRSTTNQHELSGCSTVATSCGLSKQGKIQKVMPPSHNRSYTFHCKTLGC